MSEGKGGQPSRAKRNRVPPRKWDRDKQKWVYFSRSMKTQKRIEIDLKNLKKTRRGSVPQKKSYRIRRELFRLTPENQISKLAIANKLNNFDRVKKVRINANCPDLSLVFCELVFGVSFDKTGMCYYQSNEQNLLEYSRTAGSALNVQDLYEFLPTAGSNVRESRRLHQKLMEEGSLELEEYHKLSKLIWQPAMSQLIETSIFCRNNKIELVPNSTFDRSNFIDNNPPEEDDKYPFPEISRYKFSLEKGEDIEFSDFDVLTCSECNSDAFITSESDGIPYCEKCGIIIDELAFDNESDLFHQRESSYNHNSN